MTHKKRKAFTLTELLVVVVIIGVLSAVVLPKFTKMLEGRKTTEAEEMMTAVRNEQEARCTMGRNYIGKDNETKLSSYKAGKNFNYELESVGMLAKASSGNYTLEMPSYVDGRICCSGDGCEDLNKSYPSCDDLTNTTKTPDFIGGNTNCGATVLPPGDEEEKEEECPLEDQEKTCQEYHGWSEPYTGNVVLKVNADCTGYDVVDTCKKEKGGKDECPEEKPETERDCGCGYKEKRIVKCDESTNFKWEIQTGSNVDGEGHTSKEDGWFGCGKPKDGAKKKEECEGIQVGSDSNGNPIKAYDTLTWKDDSCQWESKGCCEDHKSYSGKCENGRGVVWYTWDYAACEYKKEDRCGVWGPQETIDTFVTYSGTCEEMNVDEKYDFLRVQIANLYEVCPLGTIEGGEIPVDFKGSMCYVANSFGKTGTSCPGNNLTINPICVHGVRRFRSGEIVEGSWYTERVSTTYDSCIQSGSYDCPEDITDSQKRCVLPYSYAIYRVQK